jgi:hypothetical protein
MEKAFSFQPYITAHYFWPVIIKGSIIIKEQVMQLRILYQAKDIFLIASLKGLPLTY